MTEYSAPLTSFSEKLTQGSKNHLSILHVASEVKPYSVTGGLASVTRDLPIAQAALGHEVTVISPWYPSIDKKHDIKTLGEVTGIPFDGAETSVTLGEAHRDGVRYLFVKHPDFSRDTEEIYGHGDDAERFARFSRAIPQAADFAGVAPDIVNCHDWQTGHLPAILKHSHPSLLPKSFQNVPSTYTIHRGEYDGSPLPHEKTTHLLRLPNDIHTKTHYEYAGKANPVWSAIGNADYVNTVSPNYAKELLEEGGYAGLNFDKEFKDKIKGIVNGIDPENWTPTTAIPAFTANDLTNKSTHKQKLCDEYELDPSRPTIGIATRMEHAKGMGLCAEAIDGMVEQGWNLVIGGAGHDPSIVSALKQAAAKHPNFVKLTGWINAKETFLGSDATLVPSLSEPCGLTQLEAQSVGAVPIVRSTGGLADTVTQGKTGFRFDKFDKESLLAATQKAIDTLQTEPEKWKEIQCNCINKDNSWAKSAQTYVAAYKDVIAAKGKNWTKEAMSVPDQSANKFAHRG